MTEKKAVEKATEKAAGRVLRVTASLVQVKTADEKVVYFHAGDVIAADKVSPESLKHLEELGFIEPA